ncbi:MAG: type II toxin-antitoxin system Phd/YefM family antitoxin [bacterium]
MTKTVTLHVAKTKLAELLNFTSQGNEVIITEGKKPLARLIPISRPKKARVPGLNKDEIWVSDDFDEPLSEEFWTGIK